MNEIQLDSIEDILNDINSYIFQKDSVPHHIRIKRVYNQTARKRLCRQCVVFEFVGVQKEQSSEHIFRA